MSPGSLLYLYGKRVRVHPISELLALVGIATGVALVFAVLVANSSVTVSTERLAHGIAGRDTLEISARGPHGFGRGVVARVESVRAVRVAAPLLELRAGLRGPEGRESVTLVGADPRLAAVGGALFDELSAPGLPFEHGLALSGRVAGRLGARTGDRALVEVAGRAVRAPVRTVLDASEVGPLADSPVVAAPLSYAQQLAGAAGRVTRVLVAPKPGRRAEVEAALRRIAAGRLDVGPSDADTDLQRQAATRNRQSTGLFALVGFLFAFNAMLLTAGERRRFVAVLRLDGYDAAAVVQIVLFEALVLGAAAAGLGLLLGDQLSRRLFHVEPGYLEFAFTVGDQRVVTAGAIALSVGAGVGAALLAVARPLGDVLSRRPLDAVYREEDPAEGSFFTRPSLVVAATALLLATSAIYVLAPEAAIVGIALLLISMLLAVPGVLRLALRAVELAVRSSRFPMAVVAIGELRVSTIRSCALAAIAALAVFGSVAIGGAHRDLLRGLDHIDEAFVATADLWVTSGGDENILTIQPFAAGAGRLAAVRGVPSVADVRVYRGGLLDMAGRRLWLIARPAGDPELVPPGQLLKGDRATVTRRLRAGGWIGVSKVVADRLDLEVGSAMTLPTPAGDASFRVAALLTTFGWSPGVAVLNARDYALHWRTSDATALEVDLRPGAEPGVAKRAVEAALGARPPLTVELAADRAERFKRLTHQSLDRLSQISTLVLIAAVLALAAAMIGVLWQRRPRLAALKLSGFGDGEVWRAVLLETAIVLVVGCLIGGAFGLYGQALLARALELVAGFPVQYAVAAPLALIIVCGLALVATAVTALPGWIAARVPLRMGFHED